MSDSLYIIVSNDVPDGEPEDSDWIRADIILNGEVVSTGFAPERPPYVDGTARSSAVSMAVIKFRSVLCSDIRKAQRFKEKKVTGPS